MTKQPRDDANYPIPVLSYRPRSGQALTLDSLPQRSSAFAPSTRVITIYSTADAFFELGDSSVEAEIDTSHFIAAGAYLDVSLGSENTASALFKYCSVVSNNSGSFYISERV